MGIKELALVGIAGSAVLVGCRPTSPPDLLPPPTIPPAAGVHEIDSDKLKLPSITGALETPIATPTPEPTAAPEKTGASKPTSSTTPEVRPAKETETPTIIWFLGSSTMKNFEFVADYIGKIFPSPKFRFSINGRPGAEIENLTQEISKDSLIPVIDKKPVDPRKVRYIVIYGGANDLFNGENIVSMEAETFDLFAVLADKYSNANFIYIKPYHLTGRYSGKNPDIDAFNHYLSPEKISYEVKKRTGRLIKISIVDINNDLDNCNPELVKCYLDDRHAGPPILDDMIDKTHDLIDPPQPKPNVPTKIIPFASLWMHREKRKDKRGFRSHKSYFC